MRRRLVRAGLVLLLLVSTSSVAQWGEAGKCQVYPVSYSFVTSKVDREPEASCTTANARHTVCVGPSRLTDSELGPQEGPTNSSYYYIWKGNDDPTESYFILFTFGQTESISNITLHYYVHNLGDRQAHGIVFGAEDGFQIQSPNLTGKVYHSIDQLRTARGLNSASLLMGPNQPAVNISTTKIVLQIKEPSSLFSLSEVDFFETTSTLCPDHNRIAPETRGSLRPTTTPVTDPPPNATAGHSPTTATNKASHPVSAVAARLSAGFVAITVLIVAAVAAVVVGAIVYRRCGGKQAGNRAELDMDDNESYARTSHVTWATPPPNSDEGFYDDINTTAQEEHAYEPIPA